MLKTEWLNSELFEIKNMKYGEILDIPSLRVEKGVTVIVGASGSGKTTLLRLLNKSISPTEGDIFYKGKSLNGLASVLLRREVLLMSQQPAVFGGDIQHNLEIGFAFQNRKLPPKEMLENILRQVQLSKPLDTPVQQLSGGEKQRLAIGRVFLLEPEVYLLDEPSSALDDATEAAVMSLVVDQARQSGKSIVMVTHSKTIASQFADRLIEVADGKVVKCEVRS